MQFQYVGVPPGFLVVVFLLLPFLWSVTAHVIANFLPAQDGNWLAATSGAKHLF